MAAPNEPPALAYSEKTVADSYRTKIDREENVWRSLPYFAATLALQLAALFQNIDKLPDPTTIIGWLSMASIGYAGALTRAGCHPPPRAPGEARGMTGKGNLATSRCPHRPRCKSSPRDGGSYATSRRALMNWNGLTASTSEGPFERSADPPRSLSTTSALNIESEQASRATTGESGEHLTR